MGPFPRKIFPLKTGMVPDTISLMLPFNNTALFELSADYTHTHTHTFKEYFWNLDIITNYNFSLSRVKRFAVACFHIFE